MKQRWARALLGIAVLLLPPAPATAQASVGGAHTASADAIESLAWLVGRWRTLEPTDGGDTLHIEMTVARSPTGRAITFGVSYTTTRDTVRVAHYDSIYVWDPVRKKGLDRRHRSGL